MPNVYNCEITEIAPLVSGVYSVTVACGGLADCAHPGQFLHIKCGCSRLLRRPISICSIAGDTVRFVFEVKGEGTRWLSGRKAGQTLNALGPLGNGFTFPNGRIIVVGGGVGAPPMLFAAQSAKGGVTAILGFRDKGRIILEDEFKAACAEVIVTTDDGSYGLRGFATGPLERLLKSGGYSAVMSCGHYNMQRAVATLCKQYGVPCQVSLEERMGCGVGACLVCACSTIKDGVEEMSRVCKDGPVFDAMTVCDLTDCGCVRKTADTH